MTMSPCTFGYSYSYPFLDDMCSQSQPIPFPVSAALANKPGQTDLQKLNKPISSSSDPYLYDIITHLLEFLTKIESMRPNIKTISSNHVLCIEICLSVEQIIVRYELVQKSTYSTLSNTLLTLNAIELYINILLNNLISSIEDENAFGENDDKWQDMKNQLIELSKFVDRILLHYKHLKPDNLLPNINEVVLVKDQIIKLLNQIVLDKVQKYLVAEDKCVVSFHELLASTIGLKCEIGKQVEFSQTNFPGHQTDLYYLKYIIRQNIESTFENCYDIPPSSSSSSMLSEFFYAEILEKSGFTISKASTLAAAFISANDPCHHQSLVYWINTYLEFLFEYDIFLNDTCPRFPHKEDELNKWFKLPTERENDDNDEKVSNIDVYYINKSTDDVKSLVNNDMRFPLSEKRSNFWYHGTDHKSAEQIRLNGIDLHKGKQKQDFSDGSGFYLTPYYQYAYDWASSRPSPAVKGAVLIFECSLDKFSGIDCLDDNEWREIIKYNRSGKSKDERPNKSLRQRFNRADFIHMQMSEDGKSKPHLCEPTINVGNVSQLCIKSEKMAVKSSYELKGIIFFANP